MYSICIIVLCLISAYLIIANHGLYRCKAFFFWLLISCITAWLEFYFYLRYDSWIFDPKQICGLHILGVTIEDLVFAPCFSIIFWKLYHWLKGKYSQRVYNPDDKMLYAIIVFGIIIFNFNIGSIFGKYMALRTGIGFCGLIYCWNFSSFRHSAIFMFIVFFIAAGWDIPFVNMKVWVYTKDINNFPVVYDGMYLKIFKAIFPIELWSYYVSGAMYSFWTIALMDKYFSTQKKLS